MNSRTGGIMLRSVSDIVGRCRRNPRPSQVSRRRRRKHLLVQTTAVERDLAGNSDAPWGCENRNVARQAERRAAQPMTRQRRAWVWKARLASASGDPLLESKAWDCPLILQAHPLAACPLTFIAAGGIRRLRRQRGSSPPADWCSNVLHPALEPSHRMWTLPLLLLGSARRQARSASTHAMRHPGHGDWASLGVKHLSQAAPRGRVVCRARSSSHSARLLRLNQPRFPISCHSRPQVRRSPEL